MHRHKRTGTGRVHHTAWAAQIKHVRKAIGCHAQHGARTAVGIDQGIIVRVGDQRIIFKCRDPHIYTGLAAGYGIWIKPSIFKGFPGKFEQQSLLGIHPRGFARGNAKKFRVESVDAIQKCAVPGIGFAGQIAVLAMVGWNMPAVFRDFRDGIFPVDQHIPKSCRMIAPAGKSAADADNRNGFSQYTFIRH